MPTLAALAAPLAEVRARAERCATCSRPGAAALPAERVALLDTVARAGAGALPVTEVPSVAVAVSVDGDVDGLADALRLGVPAVVCRLHDGRLLFDLRAVRDAELDDAGRRRAGGAGLTVRQAGAGATPTGPARPGAAAVPLTLGTAGHIDHGKTALVTLPHRQEHRPPARGAGARHLHRARLRRARAARRRAA